MRGDRKAFDASASQTLAGYSSAVSIWEGLRRLDQRADGGRGRYDAPRPYWFLYGPMSGVPLAYGAVVAGNAAGWWKGMVVLPVLAFLLILQALRKWDRAHRLARPS
jgi:hypothetical protein